MNLNTEEVDSESKLSVIEQVKKLLEEKAQLLHDEGLWLFKKSTRKKHKEINQKLEALGVYQGKPNCFLSKQIDRDF